MWIRIARMLEVIENANGSNAKARVISENFSSFNQDEQMQVLDILCGNYGPSNIGEKRAISWISTILGVHEQEIRDSVEIYGDLGEGVFMFGALSEEHSDTSIGAVKRLLDMNCSSIKSDAFVLYNVILRTMSALELKWFIRYWLNTPRNGVSVSTVEKAMGLRHGEQLSSRLGERDLKELVRFAEGGGHSWWNSLPEITRIGRFIKPMLAKKVGNKLPDEYLVDVKYDGNRYQIHHSLNTIGSPTIIFNRTGKIVSDQFPDILEIFKNYAHELIVDAEIYPINEDGSPAEHKKLATRVHSKDKAKAVEECAVKLVVFDIMYNGVYLVNEPYKTRLVALKNLPSPFLNSYIAEELPQDIESSYNVAINAGYEGIMIKDLNAPYQSKRSSALLKHKPARIEFDVVILSAKYGGGKRSDVFGTYEMGVVSEDGFTSIGSVGSGLSDGDLLQLTTSLKKIVEEYDNKTDTFHVLPRIVLEVSADLVSQDADGNYGLRFPRVQRIRNDKFPADCNTIEDVRNAL